MTANRGSLRLRFALLAGATALALSACGSTGTDAGSSPGAVSPPPLTTSGPAGPPKGTTDPGTGASSMGTGSAGTAAAATIHIKSFAYSGPDSVPAGSMVVVMNMDTEAHTLTSDDGSFEAVVKAGTSVTFTAPAKPGTYPYHCTYHSNMQGTLTVK